MTSLQQLLTEEGFHTRNKHSTKSKQQQQQQHPIEFGFFKCHDYGDSSNQNKKNVPSSSSSSSSSTFTTIDEVAVRAVISILSTYVEQYLKDQRFRETVREKCYACLAFPTTPPTSTQDDSLISKLELGMESIERLVENQLLENETKLKSLKYLIRLLNIVASLNSADSTTTASTSRVSNSHISACAQLYLSFLYKLRNKDRVSARHLLQVFCDSPFLARNHLLPELWDTFFLPHLLHLKAWLPNQLQLVSKSGLLHKETRIKELYKAYNEQMDLGTKRFALYYKEWLKSGCVNPPPIPSVSLPSIRSNQRRSSETYTSRSPINEKLYREVFGPNYEQRTRSLELDHVGREKEERTDMHEENLKLTISVHSGVVVCPRSTSQEYKNVKSQLYPEANKSGYSRFLFCRTEPSAYFVHKSQVAKNNTRIMVEPPNHLPSTNLTSAITTICSSDSLSNREMSIRVVTKSWLDTHGDPVVEATLSKAPVLEGMLEVLLSSNDDEILELVISIVAELISRSEANRRIVLNADPQLEIFTRLLRSSSLFLKSSVLLYLLKPEAKQMLSEDWVPLVLRVLEFDDQLQTLFSVQCSPRVAAFYLLEQLLRGFDMERNMHNAKKVVSLGGLSLFLQRLEIGDQNERHSSALYMSSCIQADGNCRHYIANNVKKSSLVELFLFNQTKYSGCALSLLTHLLSLHRRAEITNFLNGLKNGGGCLNTMHILLVYLQQAPLEQRPLVAVILLQLDLMGDHLRSSLYREEAVDAIVEALDCKTRNEKVQEQSGRALLLLGGRFSYVGEALAETWLLKQAGYGAGTEDQLYGKDIDIYELTQLSEEHYATEDWLRKTATVLLVSGGKRLVTALSGCIANAIPLLSRASLVTVVWISRSLRSTEDECLKSLACSIFVPQLVETLNYDRQMTKRVLASLALLNLVNNSESLSKFVLLDKDFIGRLHNLCLVTWTAKELLSIAMDGLNHCQSIQLEMLAN